MAEDNNYTRPVLPTPFDEPAEKQQKTKTKKQPQRDDDSVMEDVRKSLRETVTPSERRTAYPPSSTHVCVRCKEPGAGSPYKGEFYHMSCKLEAKREDDER